MDAVNSHLLFSETLESTFPLMFPVYIFYITSVWRLIEFYLNDVYGDIFIFTIIVANLMYSFLMRKRSVFK